MTTVTHLPQANLFDLSIVVAFTICPRCKSRGTRRLGVHFDHEMICGKIECSETWEYGETYLVAEPKKDVT